MEYANAAEKLQTSFGHDVFERVAGKVVLDFGCGFGRECVELAKRGASYVIGVELQENLRHEASERARRERVSDRCVFCEQTQRRADIVFSLDSFEHFAQPSEALSQMSDLVKDDGEIWIAFAWTWYHPYGGHLFSIFPWAHLIFTEECLIRWRSQFKDDGATRFRDVAGGLNQMTIARFEQLLAASELSCVEKRIQPIRRLRWLHNRWTREFTTSLISVRLKKRLRKHQAATTPNTRPSKRAPSQRK